MWHKSNDPQVSDSRAIMARLCSFPAVEKESENQNEVSLVTSDRDSSSHITDDVIDDVIE